MVRDPDVKGALDTPESRRSYDPGTRRPKEPGIKPSAADSADVITPALGQTAVVDDQFLWVPSPQPEN